MLKCLKFVFCCKCFKFCCGYKPLQVYYNLIKDIDEETLLLPKTNKYEELFCNQELFFFGNISYDLIKNPKNEVDLSTSQIKKIVFGQDHFMIQFSNH